MSLDAKQIIPKSQSTDRVKRMLIAPQILMFLGSGKFEVIENQLPEDANLVRSYYDADGDHFVLVIASDTFEPALWGIDIPILEPPAIRRLE